MWEFAYVMKFLYPRYVEKLYQLKCETEQKGEQVDPAQIVGNFGQINLFSRAF